MPDSPSSPTADRNLLFGILALQLNFITRDALVAAMHAWVLDKARPVGQILVDQGRLTAGQFLALEGLLVEHLRAHGTPLDSLQSLAPAPEVRSEVGSIGDADLKTCLLSFQPAKARGGPCDDGPPARQGGRYRVLRPHARGGLGEVFLAEDTELHREVALKEIQEEYADDPAKRRRFVLEAEVTGGLEHPGIVPVYGLGVYLDGRPHYAMRFIRGRSLREEIDAFHAAEVPGRDPGGRRLAFRALLGRFVDVCNAIAYAHSRGVLHRDLKPANVMLGRFGETLVVDWGLAKPGVERHEDADAHEATVEPALRPASGSDAAATRAGVVLGTPAFMSPEQAAGLLDEMGPASDIYSLGSMLYVLLTGKKPFAASDMRDVLALVRAGQFAPPRQAKADTPAALDAVCRKAMAPKPAGRYATAEHLAADIEHWLADEPVSAYPEPLPARLLRWTRRHRTAVAAGVAFLACAAAGLGASTALVWRERQNTAAEKRRAEENYELARDMGYDSIRLLEEAQVQIATVPSLHAARKEALVASARAFRHFLEQQPEDRELRHRTADLCRYTANAHRLVREFDAADPLYAEAVRLYEGLWADFPDESSYCGSLALTLSDYASVDSQRGRLAEAADSLRRAIGVSEALPTGPDDKPSLARANAILSLSAVEYTRGNMAESGRSAEQAAQLFRARLGRPGGKGHFYDPLLYATALNRLAVAEREQDRLGAARSAHAAAIKVLTLVKNTNWADVPPADGLNTLAVCVLEQARTRGRSAADRPRAEKKLGEVAQQWQELARLNPKIVQYREQQAAALQFRGEVRIAMKKPTEARADFDAARDLLEKLIGGFPDLPSGHGPLGRTYLGLGRLARLEKDGDRAADWFRKADESLRRALELSPEDARNRRSLKEVEAERATR